MPAHFKRICSAIDQIPSNMDFDISELDLQFSQQSNAPSELEEDDSQASFITSADNTPTTSFTQQTENIFKRLKKRK